MDSFRDATNMLKLKQTGHTEIKKFSLIFTNTRWVYDCFSVISKWKGFHLDFSSNVYQVLFHHRLSSHCMQDSMVVWFVYFGNIRKSPCVDLGWIEVSVQNHCSVTATERHSNSRSDLRVGGACINLSGLLQRSIANQQLVLKSRCISGINTPQSGPISNSDMVYSHFSPPSKVLRCHF